MQTGCLDNLVNNFQIYNTQDSGWKEELLKKYTGGMISCMNTVFIVLFIQLKTCE